MPWRPIVLVGLAMVLFYMVDTAAFTWGPQYLDKVFPAPSGLVALAVFPYLLASGAVRLSGDSLVARYGAVPVLRVGAVVACIGLAITVFAPVWPVAVLGFLVVGGGVAVVAPLSFSAAARIAGEGAADPVLRHARVDAVIGRFNQFNYAGSLLGAVMTGLVGAGEPPARLRGADGAGARHRAAGPRLRPGALTGCSPLGMTCPDLRSPRLDQPREGPPGPIAERAWRPRCGCGHRAW